MRSDFHELAGRIQNLEERHAEPAAPKVTSLSVRMQKLGGLGFGTLAATCMYHCLEVYVVDDSVHFCLGFKHIATYACDAT